MLPEIDRDRLSEYVLSRLVENSTWRGIFAVLSGAGIMVAPEYQNAIIAIGLSVIGLINIFRKEKPTIVYNQTITQPKG
jgi:hypothetical protein